ncbi:hypothetical protein [Amycolatopsis sp.]|jgi:hypothetical protein|uniref:hypothetical protein n=1 Tax=Amycolatopsis sp. TaxID=37632 RepID=UPI002E029208|nr:hypothetical protein [Amycolatopsis sp.]
MSELLQTGFGFASTADEVLDGVDSATGEHAYTNGKLSYTTGEHGYVGGKHGREECFPLR